MNQAHESKRGKINLVSWFWGKKKKKKNIFKEIASMILCRSSFSELQYVLFSINDTMG